MTFMAPCTHAHMHTQTMLLDGRVQHMQGRVEDYVQPLNRFSVVYEDKQTGFLTFEELLTVLVYSEQWDWDKLVEAQPVAAAEAAAREAALRQADAREAAARQAAAAEAAAAEAAHAAVPSTPAAHRVVGNLRATQPTPRQHTAVRSIPLVEPPHPDAVGPSSTMDDVRELLAQKLTPVLQRLSAQHSQWKSLASQPPRGAGVEALQEEALQEEGRDTPQPTRQTVPTHTANAQSAWQARGCARPATPPPPGAKASQPVQQELRHASTSTVTTIGRDRMSDILRTLDQLVGRVAEIERKVEQPRASPARHVDVSSRLLALETAVAARDAEVALLRQKVLVAEGTAARFESKCELLQAQLAERGRLRKEVTDTLQTMTVVAPLLVTAAARAARDEASL